MPRLPGGRLGLRANGQSGRFVQRFLCVLCGFSVLPGCVRPAVVPPTAVQPAPQLAPVQSAVPMVPDVPRLAANDNPWRPKKTPRDWKHLVVHHTAANSGSVESIHEQHLKNKDKDGNPWLGIGYHFVIGNGHGMDDGAVEPTFRWKQQLAGAHAGVAEYNQRGIGIVLIGNFEKTAPTAAQLKSVKDLLSILAREYQIDADHVIGHGDVKATECPGRLFPMKEVRTSVTASRDHDRATLARVAYATWNISKETLRK